MSSLGSVVPQARAILAIRGGSLATTAASLPIHGSEHEVVDVQALGFSISPRAQAVICMAIAMALHYTGYSFARPSTVALFTSAKTGYAKSPAAFPLAMAFISPVSLGLLMMYGRALHRFGPNGALSLTTLLCSGVLSGSAFLILSLQNSAATLFSVPLVKLICGPLFVFRESYVQMLTSQYWSFMSSVLTPAQSATWFAPISGLTSIASALAGMNVSRLVRRVGLPGALITTSFMMLLSLLPVRTAYSIADKNGFNPSKEKKSIGKETESKGMIAKAASLFAREPTLGALFLEIICAQGLATVLSVCFVTKLSAAIPDDSLRAGWMGKFFAWTNVCSMTIQFGVLPHLMKVIEPRSLWRALPIVMVVLSSFQALQKVPSLYLVSGSLLAMKALEYSARRLLDEMVFVPLDFESRFLGKEVIGVFGYRFGKSTMSLFLSGLTATFGNMGLQQLSMLTSGTALLWFTMAWRLSKLVPTKAQAEALYQARK